MPVPRCINFLSASPLRALPPPAPRRPRRDHSAAQESPALLHVAGKRPRPRAPCACATTPGRSRLRRVSVHAAPLNLQSYLVKIPIVGASVDAKAQEEDGGEEGREEEAEEEEEESANKDRYPPESPQADDLAGPKHRSRLVLGMPVPFCYHYRRECPGGIRVCGAACTCPSRNTVETRRAAGGGGTHAGLGHDRDGRRCLLGHPSSLLFLSFHLRGKTLKTDK